MLHVRLCPMGKFLGGKESVLISYKVRVMFV
jgi:hypothetical protein